MTDVVFGCDYNLLETPDTRYVLKAIEESNVRVGTLLYAPWLYLGRLDKWLLFRRAISGRNKLLKFIGELVRRRQSASEPPRQIDVFSYLGKARDTDSGTGLDERDIIAESITLVIAGTCFATSPIPSITRLVIEREQVQTLRPLLLRPCSST
jgi:cytochrome P450